MSDLKAWERQPGEPRIAFHGFVHYRDLGPERSLNKAYTQHRVVCQKRRLSGDRAVKASGRWDLWSREHRWVERAAAYDAHVDREARLAAEAKIRKRREEQAEQLALVRATLLAPAMAVAQLLNDPAFVQTLREQDKGDLINMLTQAARALPAVITAERLVLGEATERIANMQEEGDYGRLPEQLRNDPEASRMVNELAARLANAGEE